MQFIHNLTLLLISTALVVFLATTGSTAKGPGPDGATPPTISAVGVTPFFMMGKKVAGVAQETSAVYKATDGVTLWNHYTVLATVVQTENMGGIPTTSVSVNHGQQDDKEVFFWVSVKADHGVVTGNKSIATVRVDATSNITGLKGSLTFNIETKQDLDRP